MTTLHPIVVVMLYDCCDAFIAEGLSFNDSEP